MIHSPSTATVSIHAPLAGCDKALADHQMELVVSIHAPLAGCDRGLPSARRTRSSFNPRTPRGVRLNSWHHGLRTSSFQSTHPSRGATRRRGARRQARGFQSTHPSRGATVLVYRDVYERIVSIHAPLAGCDFPARPSASARRLFQSTHPSRGATS